MQTAAPALFAFMGSLSSSVGLSAWRWACAVPRCGSRCFRNGQRKAIIRTHRLSETGSDYIGLVPEKGADLFIEGMRRWCRHTDMRYVDALTERHLGYDHTFMDAEKEARARAFARALMRA